MSSPSTTRCAGGPSAFRLPPSAIRPAFTLVELLVVITIIGILAGLLIAAATRGVRTARQTAIAIEIATVSQSIETYRNDVSGGTYPPDIGIGTIGSAPATPASDANAIWFDFNRHFTKAFPRHREPESLLRALCGFTNTTSRTPISAPNTVVNQGMNPAETLVFWLQRFSSDPQFPISGSGGPSFQVATGNPQVEDLASRNWIGNFDPSRYGMLVGGSRQTVQQVYESIDDGDGVFTLTELANIPRFVRYQDPQDVSGATVRQINLWQYFPPNSPQPLVYFDASRGIHDVEYDGTFGSEIHPIKQLKAGQTNRVFSNIELANAGKFQILHCGLDEEWGDFGGVHVDFGLAPTASVGNVLLFPNGPFTLELADTIVSFSDSATLEDNQP